MYFVLNLIRKFWNAYCRSDSKKVRYLSHIIGFTPVNVDIYWLAFMHSSATDRSYASNERLEFLGDSIIGSIIAEYLFLKYPLRGEGFLTEMRAKIVNRKNLGYIGAQLGIKQLLTYNTDYVNINETILGNALEALIGAIYRDAGYDKTRTFISNKIISPYIDLDHLQNAEINYKSRLLEWSQKYAKVLSFELLEETTNKKGNKTFVVAALLDGQQYGVGKGKSKKDAEKEAAKQAYDKLNVGSELTEN